MIEVCPEVQGARSIVFRGQERVWDPHFARCEVPEVSRPVGIEISHPHIFGACEFSDLGTIWWLRPPRDFHLWDRGGFHPG